MRLPRRSKDTGVLLGEGRSCSRDGQWLLDQVKDAVAPLAADFAEVSAEYDVEAYAESALDRLFAYAFLILGAREETWRSFGQFTITEAILRRDDQNRALHEIQMEADRGLRRLQARANRWAESTLGVHMNTLPDE